MIIRVTEKTLKEFLLTNLSHQLAYIHMVSYDMMVLQYQYGQDSRLTENTTKTPSPMMILLFLHQ